VSPLFARACLAAAVSSWGLVAGEARAAPVTVGTISLQSKVSAFRGRVVWSEPSGDISNRRYVLMLRYHGRTSRLPVRPRRQRAFDVDLGPDGHGGIVAVYSRCRRESALPPRACDIYRYDFTRRAERRVTRVSTAGASEQLPSIWGHRLAFLRGTDLSRAALLVVDLDSGSTTHIDGGTPPQARGVIGNAPTSSSYGPVALDLRGARLAFTWEAATRRCPVPGSTTGGQTELLSELWVATPGSTERRIAAGCTGGPVDVLSAPSLDSNDVYFTYHDDRASRYVIARTTPQATNQQHATVNADANVFAQDDRYSYFARFAGSGRYRLMRDTLAFTPVG
jgi:hypothetical protein